jgi:hypothetical protein
MAGSRHVASRSGQMDFSGTRWVLAFDASCGTCRQISAVVAQACEGRLEVLPLSQPEVQSWREQALGAQAPWAPTLLRIDGGGVHGWTGVSMAVPLARRLGPRPTVRVLRGLGQLRHQAAGHLDGPAQEGSRGKAMGRSQFLRLGAGALVAGGLIITGRAPAFAEREADAASIWVGKNQGRLPQRYAELITYPESYRKAVFRTLSPRIRSQLWVEHLNAYRAAHPALSAEQAEMIGRATVIMGRESTFVTKQDGRSAVHRQLDDLRAAAVHAFGHDEAYALLAALGPSTRKPAAAMFAATAQGGDCECSVDSNWCDGGTGQCSQNGTCRWHTDCGVGYLYWCDGVCF